MSAYPKIPDYPECGQEAFDAWLEAVGDRAEQDFVNLHNKLTDKIGDLPTRSAMIWALVRCIPDCSAEDLSASIRDAIADIRRA